MAEAVVSFVVERLGDLLIEEAKFLYGVGGQVQQIHDELKWIQAFLKDADARQHEEERIGVWVADVRALAYDAGDVLESFFLGVESKRQGGIKNILKRYICILNECVVLHKIGAEVEGIKARISELKSRLEAYGIRSLTEGPNSASERQSQLRRSYSHVDQDDFVGLEGDVVNLVTHLVNEQDGAKYYQVVSICGMGGLGKTTIAQKIYSHPKVKLHFEATAWVCISQKWQTKDVLQQILIKLLPEERDQLVTMREEELIKKLFDVQQEKSCLVVLDDIWSKDAWDCLKPAFHIGKRNSKLLLTSRNTEVATHVDPKGLLYEPRILNEDECWELLQKKAFTITAGRDLEDVEKMEMLGKEMARHCGGLPLAVIVLGGLLITKQNLREWEKVHRSIKSYIRSGDRDHHGGVLEMLVLSYNELPYHLKPCFLYLGKFSEDSEIEVDRLYQMWIGESMVRSVDQREGDTLMDVAEYYLGELAKRCMVQVSVPMDESEIRRFKSCRLHDLLRELCLFKANEEDFFRVIDFRQQNHHELAKSSPCLTNRTRRLVIYFDGESTGSTAHYVPDKEISKHLRSLLFSNVSLDFRANMLPMVKSHLNDFKLLRVLAIKGLKIDGREERAAFTQLANSLEVISNLIHLRYLSLRRTSLLMFPPYITNLKQLQTLDLRANISGSFTFTENVLQKMGSLQHLYLPRRVDGTVNESKLRLDGLSKLETLENFDPSWCDTKDLFKLSNLRKFTAHVLPGGDEEVGRMVEYVVSIVPNQSRYSSLSIFCMGIDTDVWKQLIGCGNIQKLLIDCFISSKSSSVAHSYPLNFSPSISKLTLINCNMDDPIPTLENLPNLRSLILRRHVNAGGKMICSDTGFPQLKYLELFRYSFHGKWVIHKGAMPNLARVKVVECRELKELPDGLRFITKLKELEFIGMPKEFRTRLCITDGEEGEDFHKIQHIPSILIR